MCVRIRTYYVNSLKIVRYRTIVYLPCLTPVLYSFFKRLLVPVPYRYRTVRYVLVFFIFLFFLILVPIYFETHTDRHTWHYCFYIIVPVSGSVYFTFIAQYLISYSRLDSRYRYLYGTSRYGFMLVDTKMSEFDWKITMKITMILPHFPEIVFLFSGLILKTRK